MTLASTEEPKLNRL